MCGIIAAFNPKADASVNEFVVNQFEEQHARGEEGFGVISFKSNGKNVSVHRATEGAKFMFDLHKEEAPMMVVHHRYPTSTKNKMKQTHPIKVSHEALNFDYLVVHNGVISNSHDLYDLHTDLGYVYTTEEKQSNNIIEFNDSESLAVEVARYIENQTTEVGTLGSAAFIALQLDKKTGDVKTVFFGRNTNPLNMDNLDGVLTLSSEGTGTAIAANVLYSFKPGKTIKLKEESLDWAKPPKVKNDAIGYRTDSAWKKNLSKDSYWDYDDDFYKPKDAPVSFFSEKACEEAYEDVMQTLELHLDLLDSESNIEYADINSTLADIKESLLKAEKTLKQKYAHDKLPNHGGDNEDEADLPGSLPAGGQRVEEKPLQRMENKVKAS